MLTIMSDEGRKPKMAKKIRRSKCLVAEWETLRTVCKKMHWTENQGLEYIEKQTIFSPHNDYNNVLQTNLSLLLYNDVTGRTLHLYFMDKQLRDFLCSCELMDYSDLKTYIKENGNFYPVSDWSGEHQSEIIDFPFCIHIPYEKYGYSFNCQIINGSFNLVAERENALMLTEEQFNHLLKMPVEQIRDDQKKAMKFYRLAFNTLAYINCFKEYVKDGAPNIPFEKDVNSRRTNAKSVETSTELHEEIEDFLKNQSIRAPYIKRGHFMYLKDERYVNKRGELVWRKPCMIKGKAKTVYTNQELLNSKEYTD